MFVDDDDRLAFALHPVPTSADVVAILDRIVRQITHRLADEECDASVDEPVAIRTVAGKREQDPCLLVGKPDRRPRKEVRTFGTMTADLVRMREWLVAEGCTHVGMESTMCRIRRPR